MEWGLVIAGIFAASVVVAWLWGRYGEHLEEERQAKLFELAGPMAEAAYDELTRELRTRYPLIPFVFPAPDGLLARLIATSRPRARDIPQLLEQALDPVIRKATEDFISCSPDSIAGQPVSQDYGSPKFWRSERRFRTTEDGQDPPDWRQRRAVVHSRDGGRCQRCGVAVLLRKCHIHHVVRRSEGGDHSIENLITLCRDCHSLMAGHEPMKAPGLFCVTDRGTLHTLRCGHAQNAIYKRQVWGTVPRLEAQGFMACQVCDPWRSYRTALYKWNPEIERFARDRLSAVVRSIGSASDDRPS